LLIVIVKNAVLLVAVVVSVKRIAYNFLPKLLGLCKNFLLLYLSSSLLFHAYY